MTHLATTQTVAQRTVQGTGEMAVRIRAFSWEETALGPVAGWSETLVAAVNLMLCSPFPSALYWGPELRMLYNDHYVPILDGKHPKSLGSRAAEVWAEAWDQISTSILSAYTHGSSSSARAQKIPILIDGVFQDRWWTYGFLPVYEGNTIMGVANPVVEDTAAIIAERELRRSREEFETGMEAASLGMWHYSPKTGIVVADERMHRIFGSPKPKGEVDYWLDLLHPEDRDRVGEHFAGVLAGKHDYDIDYRICGTARCVGSGRKAERSSRKEFTTTCLPFLKTLRNASRQKLPCSRTKS